MGILRLRNGGQSQKMGFFEGKMAQNGDFGGQNGGRRLKNGDLWDPNGGGTPKMAFFGLKIGGGEPLKWGSVALKWGGRG